MARDEIKKHGPITEYRPDDDSVSGGRDKSVQTEAIGAEGIENLPANTATSGGFAGKTNNFDDRSGEDGKHDGGLNDANRGLTR